MTIPTTSTSVNVDGLHPTLYLRIDAMLADPRMKGYQVVSGVRSYELQKSLYSGWRKRLAGVPGFKHYNNAANPDAAGAATFDGLRFRGSYHMVQDDEYGHAVDLRAPVTHSTSKRWELIGKVGREYGLHQTVSSEWWHLQARNAYGWFPTQRIATPTLPMFQQEEDDMAQIPVTLGVDTQTGQKWAFVVGEGGTPLDNVDHWVERINAARKTGVFTSDWLEVLIYKVRAQTK